MKNRLVCIVVAVFSIMLAAPLFAAPVNLAIFVPGVAAGSPLYEQMVSGAQKAAAEFPNLTLKVVEAGFNQAEWPEKMTSLAATGEYTYILTSNPSMPFICADVAKSFPQQKFIVMDGYFPGNPQFYTLMYNQVEQGYFAGYLAGLVTKSKMKGRHGRPEGGRNRGTGISGPDQGNDSRLHAGLQGGGPEDHP